MNILPLEEKDYDAWLPLWEENNLGQAKEHVSRHTWRRLVDPDSAVCGMAAWTDKGKMAGLVHYIVHPVTGHIEPVCYMQDVFVSPDFRRKGIGRALVKAVAMEGRTKGWARIYWLAEANNEAAKALYRDMGVKLDFNLYILPL